MTETTQTKEQAILAAAEREFLSKGFDGARTTSIAAAAGVTHAMLHYYFRTKEKLFDRVLDEKMRLLCESVLTAFGDPGLPFLERIREGMSRHFDFIAANPDLPRFIVNEVTSKPARYDMMRQKIQPVMEMLADGVQREMDELADRDEIERMDVRLLMLDILSLNIFPFVADPIIRPLIEDIVADREDFIARRKRENIETIMRRLKKH